MHAQRWAFALLILASCSPESPSTAVSSGTDQTEPHGDGANGGHPLSDTTPGSEATEEPAPPHCDAMIPEHCVPWTGCVLDHGNGHPTCRAPIDACEALPPITAAESFHDRYQSVHGQLVLGRTDPCRNHDGCAFDLRSRLCRSYTPVTACPETVEEARSIHVACSHPDQPSLQCQYGDGGGRSTFHCQRPPGNSCDSHHLRNLPLIWVESPHYQDNGCPASSFGLRGRCRSEGGRTCTVGGREYRCVRGRWRATGPPPMWP